MGTIVFPPWTESFGRKNMYIFSSALSCACCIVIGAVHSLSAAVVMRVLAGLLSAVPGTIVGGSIEDMFNSQARIWVVFWWTVASNIGLIIGPIMSSHIIAILNWYVEPVNVGREHLLTDHPGDGSSTYTPLVSAPSLVFSSLSESRGAPCY